MKFDTQIIPVILEATEEKFIEKLEKIKTCPELAEGWVQIDLADNKFVQNKSVGLDILARYPLPSRTEAHIMVLDPGSWVEGLVQVGIKRVIFHEEAGENIDNVIGEIKSRGMEVGMALSPETSVAVLKPFLDKLDIVLLMAVPTGFGGQEFIPATLDKVREVARLREENGLHFLIEVDGGVSAENAGELISAGADCLVVGSRLINGDIAENLKSIQQSIGL